MSWFQLDASTVACRVHAAGDEAGIPTFLGSLLRGMVGFTIVSIASVLPWVVWGDWLLGRIGEGGLFAVCAMVFILLSGPLLHGLIIGPGSLLIFYKLFSIAFAGYAVGWIISWSCLGGELGSGVGLLAGAIIFGWVLARAFEIPRAMWLVIPVLLVLSAGGYFGGDWVESRLPALGALGFSPPVQAAVADLGRGMCYTAGFGAGLGLAFYFCQADVREFLRAESASRARESVK
jgi:hypothetical protein